jgi:ligand-binding SRPBCC domain-containing protein
MFKGTFIYHTKLEEPLDQVWDFFKSAENLVRITEYPKVKFLSDPSTVKGNTIHMELNFPFFRLKWSSFISEFKEYAYFVDEAVHIPFPFKK